MKASEAYAAFAARVQNRLTPFVMEAKRKTTGRSAAAERTGFDVMPSNRPTAVALGVGALAVGALSVWLPEPIPLVVLCALAAVGLFCLLAAATGGISFARPASASSETIADAWPDAILVANRVGDAFYANGAFGAFVAPAFGRGLQALEHRLAGDPSASEALFRLVRAGERGETWSEEIVLNANPKDSRARTIRLSVSPFAIADGRADLALWRISDITREHDEARLAERVSELRLEAYEAAPTGLLVVGPSLEVSLMNSTMESWLGLNDRSGGDEPASLEAVFSNAGAEVLRRHFERHPAAPFRSPLEMVVRGGRRMPVRVVAGAPVAAGEVLAGSRVITVVRAEWSEQATVGDGPDRSYARHFEAAPFGIATVTAGGVITSSNSAFAAMILDGTGGIEERAADVLARDCPPDASEKIATFLQDSVAGRADQPAIEFQADRNGRSAARRLYVVPLSPAAGSNDAAILYVVDTTEQRELEAKFAQSQKMEAIGKLAGEMAHNFNNVLTAIIGSAELMLQNFRVSDPAHRDIQNIRQSAFRAAELVNQLMSFSRQQTLRLEFAHLGEWVTELKPTVKAALGEKVELKISSDRDLWYARADRTQIQQVLMNFASNARDAMPGGGMFRLEVRNVSERDVLRLDAPGLPVAEYVSIEAEDTGGGMPDDVLAKIFDPFFTTKEIGKGTGLGLASVYGIVKQLSGYIFCKSEVGKGTVFRIFLPRAHPDAEAELAQAQRAAKREVKPVDLTGDATVLVVDDDDMVRSVAKRQLVRLGYSVLEAGNGQEALDVISAESGKVDIVISDVVMPEMDGPTFLKAVRLRHPDLKIIFVSGHTNDAFRATIGGDETFAFLQKPFSLPKLAETVKEELAR